MKKLLRSLLISPYLYVFLVTSLSSILAHIWILNTTSHIFSTGSFFHLEPLILHNFIRGVFFDLSISFLLTFILLLFTFFLPHKIKLIILAIIASCYCFYIGADYFYFVIFATHIPIDAFSFLTNSHKNGLITNMLFSRAVFFSVSFLLFFLASSLCLIIIFYFLPKPKETSYKRLIASLLTLFILAFISHRAGFIVYHNTRLSNPLMSSAIHYLWYTQKLRSQNPVSVHLEKPVKEIAFLQQNILGGTAPKNPDFKDYPLVRDYKADGCEKKETPLANLLCDNVKNKKINILILSVESFRSHELITMRKKLKLDKLYSWINKGIYFTNFYANGVRSNNSLPSMYCSMIARKHNSAMLSYPLNHLLCLPRLLQKQGNYSTSWYHESNNDFYNYTLFTHHIGFKRAEGEDYLPMDQAKRKIFHVGLGYADEILLSNWLEQLSKEKTAFFSSAFTISTHFPYEIPSTAKPLFKSPSGIQRRYNAYHYTADQIANFLDKAQHTKWYKNTLIFILADHSTENIAQSDHPLSFKETLIVRSHTPLLIVGGLVTKPAKVATYASQMDLAPTIMDLLGKPYTAAWAGKSLLQKGPRYLFHFTFENNWFVINKEGLFYMDRAYGKSTVFNLDKNQAAFFKQTGEAYNKVGDWILQANKYWIN